MRNRYGLAAFLTTSLFLFLLLSACNRRTVDLNFTTARDEVPTLGNLTFRFDQPLVKDSMLDRWDSTQYVSYEPKIPGRFRWEHPDELVFSPSQPLPPATTFRATLKSDLLQYSSFGRITGGEDLVFHTPDLHLENTSATWILTDENSTTAVPQAHLQFNYPINPNTLKDKLTIKVDGKPVNYSLLTLSASDRIDLRLLDLKMEDKTVEAKITVDRGLLPEGGTNAMKENIEQSVSIPSPYVLTIGEVTTDHDGTTGTIHIQTSQQIVPAGLTSAIGFSPAVKFSVEPSENGFTIHSDGFDQSKSYTLTVAKGLRGRIGGILHEEYTTNITFGELAPSIGFANSKGVYLSGKGAQNIEVKIINVPRVEIVISKVYENNLLAASNFGYNPRVPSTSSESSRVSDEEGDGDGEAPSDYYYGGSNSDITFGDVIYRKEVDTRTLPKSSSGGSGSHLLNLNIADQVPDFKGIYHVMVRSVKNYWVRDKRFVSLSDIGLIAKEGREKLLVFANSIKTASPMPGVNILAYGFNNQLLGMGATGADGVAEIAYTRKDLAGFKPAMIIAKTADDFNYLPFGTTRVNTSRFEVGGGTATPRVWTLSCIPKGTSTGRAKKSISRSSSATANGSRPASAHPAQIPASQRQGNEDFQKDAQRTGRHGWQRRPPRVRYHRQLFAGSLHVQRRPVGYPTLPHRRVRPRPHQGHGPIG